MRGILYAVADKLPQDKHEAFFIRNYGAVVSGICD